jgi:hypothetical protein
MAQEYKPGEIVPQSGIYTITHDPVHADMPHEVHRYQRQTFSDLSALQRRQVSSRSFGKARRRNRSF